MQVVHGRSKHKLILPNELNQPIGPTKEVVSELGSFLGTSARNGTVCPLNVFNWKMLKTHDDMWNYIKEKYDFPEFGKDWAVGTIKLAWRGYKCRLKKMHFYTYADDATRMAKRPKFEMFHTNKENQKKLRYPHTVGKTSFAIICEEDFNDDLHVTRKKRRKLLMPCQGDSGPSSQTVDDEMMQKKIEEMEERMQQRMQEKFNAQKDTMERDVTVNIIAQLQHLNPRLTLDPNMLGLTVGSPRGRAALQLINRPSVGCNNQVRTSKIGRNAQILRRRDHLIAYPP
ncbi:hypothetical protein KY290_021176 [Solanum tuberosum]|uniref:Uncharacterized protein n=1 Tax=Solanum tuberosum TaxID=4113 RepID=A0ABQ7V0R0_SOLTU|nr:hypothetical protein KY289_020353 [Solanum tuberosum]KAH0693009.1 hypothetical protein KY285_020106 [Solanum tuberosum]KAH0757683.1 hypothetical protein KY290_021176 [Solanum tuberosum]